MRGQMRGPELFRNLQFESFSNESAVVREDAAVVVHGRLQVQLHVEDHRAVP